MPSAGPNSPGTLANGSVNTNNWTNPSNAGASDNAYATLAANGNPGRLDGYNLGFAIPAGSSIDGIVVEVEIKISTGSDTLDVNLAADLPGGSGFASTKFASYDTTEGYKTFGSSSDTWGRAWTAAEINSSNFGAFAAPEAASGTVSVDHIRVTVYYTPASALEESGGVDLATGQSAEFLALADASFEALAAIVLELAIPDVYVPPGVLGAVPDENELAPFWDAGPPSRLILSTETVTLAVVAEGESWAPPSGAAPVLERPDVEEAELGPVFDPAPPAAAIAASEAAALASIAEGESWAPPSGAAPVLERPDVDELELWPIFDPSPVWRAYWPEWVVLLAALEAQEQNVVDGTTPAAITTRGRIRIDVYDASGAKLDAGPITDVLAFDYALELDRIGAFSCDIPATSRQGDSIAQGYELRFHREGEGLVFRGIVERVNTVVGAGGQLVRRVSGPSIARELARLSTLLGRSYSGATLAAAVGDNATAGSLLHATGWAPGSLASPATTLLARFDGPSRWEALAKVAEIFRVHVREDNLNREVDLVAAGTASGVVFQNVEAVTPELAGNTSLFPISGLEVEEESEDLVTTVIPLGAGEGLNQLDLRYATRATPYAISSGTGPDGRTYYYLEDASAVASYGRRERVLSVKDAIPLANSAAGFTAAANALYDVAATFLSRASSPLVSYRVAVTGLRHLGTSGTPLFELGQTVRVVYRGIVREESTGARAWRSIDANLYLMGFRRSFDDAGGDAWQLTVNSVDRYQDDPATRIAEAFQSMRALQVSLRNYTYHEVHILNRTSIESGKNATLTVKWDANISLVHQAKLTFKVQALRSNVSVAAAGGAATSSAGGAQTSSSGGATTSSAGSSHTHSVSGQTASAGGSHSHIMFEANGTDTSYATSAPNVASTQDISQSHTHTETGGTTSTQSQGHTHSLNSHTHLQVGLWTMLSAAGKAFQLPVAGGVSSGEQFRTYETVADHTHSVTATTSGAEGSHTHTVGNHTHTVADHTHTVGNHTHTLTYGIYEASSPSSPAINITINGVNRTAALGGAWNTVGSDVTVDITAYLQSGSTELPLQQSNTIVISGNVLADVEAVLRSRVTASSLVPV